MPGDQGQKTWRPKRGPMFKAMVWVLLVLIVGGALAGLVIGLTL